MRRCPLFVKRLKDGYTWEALHDWCASSYEVCMRLLPIWFFLILKWALVAHEIENLDSRFLVIELA